MLVNVVGQHFLRLLICSTQKHRFEIHQSNKKYKPEIEKYIIWLRNPISRFISAFMYNYMIYHTDVRKLPNIINTENSICPEVFNSKRECVFERREKLLMLA